MPDAELPHALINALNDDDLMDRGEAWSALQAYAHSRHPQLEDPWSALIPVLIAVLDTRHGYVREQAAQELGRLKAEVSVAKLIAMLEANDYWERKFVIKALGEIGDPRAIPALAKQLQRSGEITLAVAALAKIDDPAAAQLIEQVLKHDIPFYRELAVAGVANAEYLAAAPTLIELTQDTGQLQHSTDGGPVFTVADSAVKALGKIRTSQVRDHLARMLDGPKHGAAAQALAEHGGPEIIELSIDLLAHSDSYRSRAGAVTVLELSYARDNASDTRIGPALTRALLDPHPQVRMNACSGVAALQYEPAVPRLIHLLGDDTVAAGGYTVNGYAASAIARMDPKDVVPQLVEKLASANNDVVPVLIRIGGDDVIHSVAAMLTQSEEPSARMNGVSVLGALKQVDLLSQIRETETNNDVISLIDSFTHE